MSRAAAVAALLICTALAPMRAQQAKPGATVTGKWTMALNMSMGISRPTLTLQQNGEKLTGTYAGRYGSFPLEGPSKAARSSSG